MSISRLQHHLVSWAPNAISTYIDLCILKALLQILINCLVGDLADQGKVRHSNFLFLRALKYRFSNFRLPSSIVCALGGCQFFLAAGAFCDSLFPWTSDTCAATHNIASARTIPPSYFHLTLLAQVLKRSGMSRIPGFPIRQCSERDRETFQSWEPRNLSSVCRIIKMEFFVRNGYRNV